MSEAIAIIDASIVYGASRWLHGVHEDSLYSYAGQYKPLEDKQLFIEFLHDLLLYDTILLDNSSVSIIGDEITELCAKVNASIGDNFIRTQHLATINDLSPVVSGVCRLFNELIKNNIEKQTLLYATRIPWAYKAETHIDRPRFEDVALSIGLNESFIPFALFAYRGLCYAGYTNNYAKTNSTPAVYISSPGRMEILRLILSSRDIHKLEYPKQAYADLINLLKLPDAGYDFSFLSSLSPMESSLLSLNIEGKTPREALRYVLRLRQSYEAQQLRNEWANRIWNRSQSSVVGVKYSQSIENAQIGGNVYQIIHGSAEDY